MTFGQRYRSRRRQGHLAIVFQARGVLPSSSLRTHVKRQITALLSSARLLSSYAAIELSCDSGRYFREYHPLSDDHAASETSMARGCAQMTRIFDAGGASLGCGIGARAGLHRSAGNAIVNASMSRPHMCSARLFRRGARAADCWRNAFAEVWQPSAA